MSKKCYRFFGGLLNAQANWLNQMSQKGYRLVRTGRMLYEFEKCNPDEVTYCVEFIGEKFDCVHGRKWAVVLQQTQQLLTGNY